MEENSSSSEGERSDRMRLLGELLELEPVVHVRGHASPLRHPIRPVDVSQLHRRTTDNFEIRCRKVIYNVNVILHVSCPVVRGINYKGDLVRRPSKPAERSNRKSLQEVNGPLILSETARSQHAKHVSTAPIFHFHVS